MTIDSSLNKTKNWINKNSLVILIGLIVFVFLIKQGIIPETFSIQTLSIFGGGVATISLGAILIAIGLLGLFFAPATAGLSTVLAPLFLLGAWLIAGGTAITAFATFLKTIPGIIVLGLAALILFKRFAK